jgi:glycosyltransferase involved in cell wall biosynthesis
MAGAVARRGHEVAIYTTDRALAPGEQAALAARAHGSGVALRMFREQAPRVLATSWPLARALAEAVPRADVVHLHSLYLFHVWAAARLCRRHGVPYLLRPHGTLDPFLWQRHRARKWVMERAFQNRVIRQAAALHFTAAEEMALAAPYAHGAPGIVVPNGLDLSEYADLPSPGGFRARHPAIGGRRIVLFLSRLNFKKGLDLLVPGFAQALQAVPDLHLAIAGPDDGMRQETERLVAAAGFASRVTFAGMLEHRRKLEAFRDAAMFVLPSYSENFGIAVVEAMACRVPVAISDKVNIWREVRDAGAGVVGPATIGAVAEQIVGLARNPDAPMMGERGRKLVEAKFSWDNIARDLETVYRSLAAKKPT